MILDVTRGEIQLDDLFNAIEHDKDQVTQALELYSDYLKLKNDEKISGENKIELLERILKLECIEKTIVNHNYENERSRINLKWSTLSECGFWCKKLCFYEKAIQYFEKANSINNRVSTIYYEMGMCYLELGNIYQVKICFEKTIEISHERIHWKCLEQIICFYYILGNFSKCLEYIRLGYDHVSTYQSIYDFGQLFLLLLEKKQPSMKIIIDKMFLNEIEYMIGNEDLSTKIKDLEEKIQEFKSKLFRKKDVHHERKSIDEHISVQTFPDLGQHLVKKIRESNNDNSKLCKLIDIKKFLPKVEEEKEKPVEQQVNIVEDQPPPPPPPPPTGHRKKRSSLPLNIDDYEKRRSIRSIARVLTDETNISVVDQLKQILTNEENSSDDENDETVVSPDNLDDESSSTPAIDAPKETVPSLHIDFNSFIQKIEKKIEDGCQYHYIDFTLEYINELTQHSSTLWSNEMRACFTKLFDCVLEHVQYSTTEIDGNHLQACLCYVENAIGSSKSDLSEDSIERFSCLARLKVKYKSLGHCFSQLQFYLYSFKNSSLQRNQFEIDEKFYRILWISSLYYFLSDIQEDAFACINQLQRIFSDTQQIILPNLFNHRTISKNTIEAFCLRLKNNNEISCKHSSSSSSQELTYILSRIAVAEENDELATLIKRLEKKIRSFYGNLSIQNNLQQKSLVKCYETLVNVLKENQHLNEKENVNVRKIFDQILIQIIDMILKILDNDIKLQDQILKNMEKLTLNLIDCIMKRDSTQNTWRFKSTNPWIFLYRVSTKRNPRRNEQFLVSFVRTIHELFGKDDNCLIQNGSLLEYFLLELIQIEHPDIRKRLFSKTNFDNQISNTGDDDNDDTNEQKGKSSKVIDEIEQCIYCLYGLVIRKSKMKYLNDHNCRSLELTLEKASIVFYALRPRQLPGYEGRACTITNETETLFQRFESMIEWDDEREQRRKLLLSYISDTASINNQGKQSDELQQLSDKQFKTNNALFEKDLYYLFADYYLKMASKDAATIESSKKKAQDYYIKDLCLNTRRFDSWAGLTVIEFYKIEEFITADDFDPRIFNVHMSASCFFRQAVSVDTNNHTLWMEYAEITYILQSYCSKYKDKALEYVPDRSFLLNICKEAYEKANVCTDNDENKEDWVYLYMMGKIEEKLNRNQIFDSLKRYVAALDLLHENKAIYPRKLGHQTSTSNSKGTLLGCHAIEMFYRTHASALKYLNRHSKESSDFTMDKLNELYEFLTEMQTKPFATSYYEKSNIPIESRSGQLINELYFSHKSNLSTDPWLNLYNKCIWLCIEGLYICIARYNRHYRALYRLAHFFHTNEHFRNDTLSLEFLLGGKVLELKNYPKIIGLYQERSKHNLFNGIWRIQPLDAERTGSFSSSMYKSMRLFIDLLLHSQEQFPVLFEALRQLLCKPDADKKYVREMERRMLCQHAVKSLYRIIKKKVLLKTRDDIEREAMKIITAINESESNDIPLPFLFETSINFYNLIKNYPDFYQQSRADELVEMTFQRYRLILKFSNQLPEHPKADNLTLIYTPKKTKPKKRALPTQVPMPTSIRPTSASMSILGNSPVTSITTTKPVEQPILYKRPYTDVAQVVNASSPLPSTPTTMPEQPLINKRQCNEAPLKTTKISATTSEGEQANSNKNVYNDTSVPTPETFSTTTATNKVPEKLNLNKNLSIDIPTSVSTSPLLASSPITAKEQLFSKKHLYDDVSVTSTSPTTTTTSNIEKANSKKRLYNEIPSSQSVESQIKETSTKVLEQRSSNKRFCTDISVSISPSIPMNLTTTYQVNEDINSNKRLYAEVPLSLSASSPTKITVTTKLPENQSNSNKILHNEILAPILVTSPTVASVKTLEHSSPSKHSRIDALTAMPLTPVIVSPPPSSSSTATTKSTIAAEQLNQKPRVDTEALAIVVTSTSLSTMEKTAKRIQTNLNAHSITDLLIPIPTAPVILSPTPVSSLSPISKTTVTTNQISPKDRLHIDVGIPVPIMPLVLPVSSSSPITTATVKVKQLSPHGPLHNASIEIIPPEEVVLSPLPSPTPITTTTVKVKQSSPNEALHTVIIEPISPEPLVLPLSSSSSETKTATVVVKQSSPNQALHMAVVESISPELLILSGDSLSPITKSNLVDGKSNENEPFHTEVQMIIDEPTTTATTEEQTDASSPLSHSFQGLASFLSNDYIQIDE